MKDANAVKLYGQLAYENNQEAMEQVGLLRDSLPRTEFGDVYNNISSYNVMKEMKFAGAYPIITGFTDADSWNHMTPVLGYRFIINDPVGLSSMKLTVGTSPWSNNKWKNKFHIDFDWKYYFWTLKAAWNHTDFYDLFGPLRKSRKGYVVSLAYDYTYSLVTPYSRSWGFSVATYGDMDALPLFQEIEVKDVTSMQTASIYGKWSKTRTSLGGVMKEQGYALATPTSVVSETTVLTIAMPSNTARQWRCLVPTSMPSRRTPMPKQRQSSTCVLYALTTSVPCSAILHGSSAHCSEQDCPHGTPVNRIRCITAQVFS